MSIELDEIFTKSAAVFLNTSVGCRADHLGFGNNKVHTSTDFFGNTSLNLIESNSLKTNNSIKKTNISPNNWYKDKNGINRFDKSVKNQTDVDKIAPGGKYIGSEFNTKTANFYSDGSAFFKNEHDGYKFMIDNSNMQSGKNEIEHVGWITKTGIAVLPKEGRDLWGNAFKNSSLHSEIMLYDIYAYRKNSHLFVDFHGRKIRPIAWIHTHPDSEAGFSQSAGDTSVTNFYGIPSIVIGRNHIYGQSVNAANGNRTGIEVLTRYQLEIEKIPIISNIHLFKK
ncbi:hypothetical protein [Flavobacterium sp.]|uniref:hypothetical protein n=1 Tax=Flavobacterium sp. TaxID=239 RepID=UPI00286E4C0B|nr:hypothetical protein [Flavobacterium sp.]